MQSAQRCQFFSWNQEKKKNHNHRYGSLLNQHSNSHGSMSRPCRLVSVPMFVSLFLKCTHVTRQNLSARETAERCVCVCVVHSAVWRRARRSFWRRFRGKWNVPASVHVKISRGKTAVKSLQHELCFWLLSCHYSRCVFTPASHSHKSFF